MNHTDLYWYLLGFALRGPLGPEGRQPAAANNCGCLARGGARTEFASSRLHIAHLRLRPSEARNQTNSTSYFVFEGSHFPRLIQNSCNQPRPEINLTRRVRSFLRVPHVPTSQGSSGTAATIRAFLRVPTSQGSSGTAATNRGQKST